MGIHKPIPTDFDSAYHEWIISKNIYVDQYGFIVPIGKYHPRLVNTEELRVDEEDYEEHKNDKFHGKTPEKRLRNAIDLIPSLREYNHDLKHICGYRPDYEEILYHFRQMEMYLNNEAKAQANQIRQESCWTDFLMKITENINDNSIEEENDVDEFENSNFQNKGHMFSVANRVNWDQESWQNIDIQVLCQRGISYNLRNRIWYDLLEVKRLEDMTMYNIKQLKDFDDALTPYENLKLIAIQNYNIAFAQIDEDMKTLNISNTPSRDDRGKIKNILK